MRRTPWMSFVSLVLICVLFFPSAAPLLNAQAPAPSAGQKSPPPPTAQELDQLMAPIALYPDALLAQITTASTNPQEILDVTNWLAKNPSLTGPDLTAAAEKQGYDPAFLALITFPKVLQMMSDHIDDYAAIGLAVTANQADVSASIQRLRAQAYEAGSLRSNEQQKVEVQQASSQPIYVIQPVNPLVAYVPIYNPTLVYVAAPSTTTALITFGIGIGISALVYSNQPWGWGGWGWGWGRGGVIYYNRGPWGGIWVGGYRPPVYWYHPRPPYYRGYPGYGGNWGYRPPHYRPPYPTHPPAYRPPNHRPPQNGTPGYRPPASTRPLPPNAGNRPPTGNRPSTRPAQPGTGTRPPGGGNQPGTRPAQPGTGTRPPGGGNQPGTRPAQPGTGTRPPGGGNQPSTRPAPQPGGQPRPAPRPSTQTRPAPRLKN
jgi:hypothetical protein